MTGKNNHQISKITKGQSRRLRRELTPAEVKLWSVLRNGRLDGYKFRRQHPIRKYIVDFCCEEVRLIIEIDGDMHVGNETYDEKRTNFLEEKGYRVIRFTNDDVHGNLDAVAMRITEQCDAKE